MPHTAIDHGTWTVTVTDDPDDANGMLYLSATLRSATVPGWGDAHPVTASARITRHGDAVSAELSEWQNTDGVSVDLPKLSASVQRLLAHRNLADTGTEK